PGLPRKEAHEVSRSAAARPRGSGKYTCRHRRGTQSKRRRARTSSSAAHGVRGRVTDVSARSDGRTGPAVQPVNGPRGAERKTKEDNGGSEEGAKEKHEQKHEQKPGEEGKESRPQPQAEVTHTALSAERGTPPSPLSLLSPRGSRRRAEADEAAETDEAKMPGTPAVTTGLEAEEASAGTGREPEM
ncbi:hypothetical protein, partial [Streptomyces canarius]